MPKFSNGQVSLSYDSRGQGPVVVLLHGFGMTGARCWIDTGWADRLTEAGFRSVVLDCRGHGMSDKPHDASAYQAETMTQDVIELLDCIGAKRAHIIGHSMGARTAFDIALHYSDRLISLLAISLGSNLLEAIEPRPLIKAFRGEDIAQVPEAIRQTADTLLSIGNDRDALIACLSAPRPVPAASDLGSIRQPVMVACGDEDRIVGDPQKVVAALPRARACIFRGYEHTDILACEALKDSAIRFLGTTDSEECDRP